MSGFVFEPLKREPEAGEFRFVPVGGEGDSDEFTFIPIEPDRPSTLRNVALNNPLTAIGETALNLASTGVAMPVAGLAGLATEAGRAVGLTDKTGADVVHAVGDALTYQPRGEMGQAATQAVMYPFEKLHEAATWAGNKTQDATGSPGAATAAHTLVEGVLPLVAFPAAKAGRAKWQEHVAAREMPKAAAPEAPTPEAAGEYRFTPTEEARNVTQDSIPSRVSNLETDQGALQQPESFGVAVVRRDGDQGMPSVDGELRQLPERRGAETERGDGAGAAGHGEGLRADEYRMDNGAAAERPAESMLLRDRGQLLDDLDGGRQGEVNVARDGLVQGEGAQNFRPGDSLLARQAAEIETQRPARWALIEADSLKASHDVHMRARPDHPFAKEVARGEQEAAVAAIVRDIDPQRLVDAIDDADGAPIVARDGTVETGQRRAIALQRAYQANGQKAADYRQTLRDQAPRLGLDPAAIDGMKKPVLVRLPDQEAPRRPASADFSNVGESHISNTTKTGYLSKSEIRTPGDVQKSHIEPDTQAMAGDVQNGTWNPGQNYAPFVDHMRAPEARATSVADLPAPIRRETIIKDFADALGATVYEGRVKGKNRLGFFRPKNEETRIKNAADIEVAAHELAHLIDSRVPELSSAWRSDKALREELKSVSYDQKSVPEGFAEGVRLWMTQPETLEARAPKVAAWLDDFAARHEYGPAMKKAQEQMTGWFGQDALNRARSKIGTEKPLAEYFDRAFDKFRQSTVDDLHGIMQMERDLTGKLAPVGPYESARLSRASASIADGAVRFGHPVKKADGSFAWAGKGLEDILKPVAESLDDTLLYFVGRSARELHGQGREHLFTMGEIDAMLRLKTPERAKAFEEYQT